MDRASLVVDHISQVQAIKDKKVQTCLTNYGVENPNQSPVIRARTTKTNMERYGFENPLQNPEIKDKSKETCLAKYGFDNAAKSPDVISKITESWDAKYNGHPLQNATVRQKRIDTCKERYGVAYVSQNQEIQDKVRKTRIEKDLNNTDEFTQAFNDYCNIVERFTERSWRRHHDRINPTKLMRGKLNHLDHKFSKSVGFASKIPPEIIGHWSNLELLPRSDNLTKGPNCSITLEELLESYKRGDYF